MLVAAMATGDSNDPAGSDWTDQELDLIVADYFDMLRLELTGQPYVKAHRNAALRELIGRSRASIEFKHRNISAVSVELGLPRINGYLPATNYQASLIQGIERYLQRHGPGEVVPAPPSLGLADAPILFFEAPPAGVDKSSTPPRVLQRLVRKFDPAARDARNRVLGRSGEERVYVSERSRLTGLGRDDLARKVRWVSEEDGDGAGYDILSFDASGVERLLEVKTTVGHGTTPFYLTENERLLSVERPDAFRLVRLYDFARTPRAFELVPPLEAAVNLHAVTYRASFGRAAGEAPDHGEL
jgi:hypothetical protein